MKKFVACCLVLSSLLLSGVSQNIRMSVTAEDSVVYTGNTETYTFDKEEYNDNGTLKYFTPYFIAEHGETGKEVNWEGYWASNFDKGTLTTDYTFAEDDAGKAIEMYAGNASYLTLNTRKYQHFEAVLTFKYADFENMGWIGITFGQTQVGYGYKATGGGTFAFAQKEGTCTMEGETVTALSEGVIPSAATQEKFSSGSVQLRLRVFGTDATVETLNEDGSVLYGSLQISDPNSNTKIPEGGSYTLQDVEGYVSILSAGGYHTIESFSITPIEGDSALSEAQTQVQFNEEDSLKNFLPYYTQSSALGAAGEAQEISSQWGLTEEETLLRIDGLGLSVDGSISHLYWNEKIRYFEATIVYRNRTGNDGWIGIEFGLQSLSDRFIETAHGAFIQRNGTPTLAGVNKKTTVAYEEGSAPKNYNSLAWHTFRLRVTTGKVEYFLDDMTTPSYTTQLSSVQEGYLGIFATGLAQLEIRSFSLNRLDGNGVLIG